jgi:hypothetical protein
MTEFKQSDSLVERARAYLADVQMGHVSFADESAPFMTLTGYLADLLAVIDGTREARACRVAARHALRQLLAAGPLPCCGLPGQLVSCWIDQLRTLLLQMLGVTAAQLAEVDEEELRILRQAVADATSVRAAAALQPCPRCLTHPALLCPRHAAELDWVSAYRALADDLDLDLAQARPTPESAAPNGSLTAIGRDTQSDRSPHHSRPDLPNRGRCSCTCLCTVQHVHSSLGNPAGGLRGQASEPIPRRPDRLGTCQVSRLRAMRCAQNILSGASSTANQRVLSAANCR